MVRDRLRGKNERQGNWFVGFGVRGEVSPDREVREVGQKGFAEKESGTKESTTKESKEKKPASKK